MAKYRHLENAPITEALIDLRVKMHPDFNVEEFSSLKEVLVERYPKSEERRVFSGGFGIKDGKPIVEAPKVEGIDGYLFRSSDTKKVVQFRKDGFTFSRLKPYTNWEDILTEAKDLWQLYVAKSYIQTITRIAVRYINHLKIPLPIEDFSDYLTVPPNVPDDIPQACIDFLSKVTVYDQARGINAIITQSFEAGVEPEYSTIIIDIDVFKRKEFDLNTDEIWPVFEQLRDLKNAIFFGSITEKTARMFE